MDASKHDNGAMASLAERPETAGARRFLCALICFVVGLAAFVILVIGALAAGVSAVWKTEGVWAAACAGLLVGITGQLLQQTMDFSLWVDPAWYTFALMIALLGTAPTLACEDPDPTVGTGPGIPERSTVARIGDCEEG